jgi:hypothetical protein
MSKEGKKEIKEDSSSSSSMVGPAMAGLGFYPIFSQPRLLPAFNASRME